MHFGATLVNDRGIISLIQTNMYKEFSKKLYWVMVMYISEGIGSGVKSSEYRQFFLCFGGVFRMNRFLD